MKHFAITILLFPAFAIAMEQFQQGPTPSPNSNSTNPINDGPTTTVKASTTGKPGDWIVKSQKDNERNCGDISVLLKGTESDTLNCLGNFLRIIRDEFNVGVSIPQPFTYSCEDTGAVLCTEIRIVEDAIKNLGDNFPDCEIHSYMHVDHTILDWRKQHQSSSSRSARCADERKRDDYDVPWSPDNDEPWYDAPGSNVKRDQPYCGDVSVVLEGRSGDTRDCLGTLTHDIQSKFKVDVMEQDCYNNADTILCIEIPVNLYEDECDDFVEDAIKHLSEDLPESCKVTRRYKTIRRARQSHSEESTQDSMEDTSSASQEESNSPSIRSRGGGYLRFSDTFFINGTTPREP